MNSDKKCVVLFFNADEHQAVPFVELARCGSYVGHLTLNYLPEHSHSHTRLILLIAWNPHCYLHFAFCLFAWSIKLKFIAHQSRHLDCFRGSYVILTGWKGKPWNIESLGRPKLEEDLILKEGSQTHLHIMNIGFIEFNSNGNCSRSNFQKNKSFVDYQNYSEIFTVFLMISLNKNCQK